MQNEATDKRNGVPKRPVPAGWRKTTLGKVAETRTRKMDPLHSRPVPYVGLEHLETDTAHLTGHSCSAGTTSLNTVFQAGDILFGKLRPYLRKCVQVGFDGCCSGELLAIHAKDRECCQNWLTCVFQVRDLYSYCAELSAGTKMPRVSWSDLQSFEFLLPPLPEQKKIAAILSSVDRAVEKTEALIAKLKDLKAAMMQELLTKGIGHTRFKNSPIGRVPVEWDVVRLGEVYRNRKESGWEGLPVASVTMNDGLVLRSSLDRKVDSDLTAEQHLLAREGDLAYNTMRMWQGVSGVARHDCIISPAYVVCQPTERIHPSFAAHMFKLPAMIQRLHQHSQGLTDDRLRLYYEYFAEVMVALPPIPEQRRIALAIDSVQNRLRSHIYRSSKLHSLRKPLIQDLLTGRVRVKV